MTTTAPAAMQDEPALRRGWIAFAIGAVLLCLLFSTLALSGSTIDTLVAEDGPIEWAGAIGLLAGGAMFLAAGVLALQRGVMASGKSRLGALVLLAMGLALLFLGGEEISWGQRLLGFDTPDSIAAANAQDETTLHNLNPFQGTLFDGDRLFRVGWVALFVLLPIAAWLLPRWRDRLRALLPVVPLWLAGLFAFAFVLTHVAIAVFDGAAWDSIYAAGSAATELQEAAIELLMGTAALVVLLGVLGRGRDSGSDRDAA